jgi:hypothetical protein
LVFSIHDSTTEEVAIEKMIEASHGIITIMGSQGGEEMSPPMKKHLELEIKTLKNAPRDADKLERLLEGKKRQKEEALYFEDTQRLVT